MYTVCLALAVKSGRLSLLLQTACLLSSNNNEKKDELTISSYTVLKDLISCIRTSISKLEMIKISTKNIEFQQLSHLQRRNKSLSQKPEDSNFESMYPFLNLKNRQCHRSMNRLTLSFGKADHGKLGLGDQQLHRLVPTIIESLKDINITKISSMGTTTVCIDLGGSAYMWGVGGSAGSNSQVWSTSTYGYSLHDHQINAHPRRIKSLPFGSIVVDISCGLGHVLFLMQTGQVYSSGSGGNGRLGLGDVADRKEPCLVMLEGSFCCYCCYHSCC
jgi:alpha-tubulin suppressor-like RCC1 family protein